MMKELRSLLIGAACCMACMLGAVLLLLGGHDPIPVAQPYLASTGTHFRVRDCQPIERDNLYVHTCTSSEFRFRAASIAEGGVARERVVAFSLVKDCSPAGPAFHRCMQRFARIGSKTGREPIQFTAYEPAQPDAFLSDLIRVTR